MWVRIEATSGEFMHWLSDCEVFTKDHASCSNRITLQYTTLHYMEVIFTSITRFVLCVTNTVCVSVCPYEANSFVRKL